MSWSAFGKWVAQATSLCRSATCRPEWRRLLLADPALSEHKVANPVPSGEPPDDTGQWPVLPDDSQTLKVMSDSGSIAETIFIGARQLSEAQQRSAFLDNACGDDRALLERVERMLNAEQKADQFLANNPLQVDQTALVPVGVREAVGSMIGRYKLLQQIGEGGCGVVYMAEQEQPIRRRVALKVIKPGMDTRQVIARFEVERQAVSMMDHPNIARVLDAGATEAGRPYFVMELVRGIRITDYCDQNNLSTRERLELFAKVVQAVQHAHQKGIIHRDLKPSNVLVTLHDGVPVPKVIDFGIAKALEQKLTDKTLFTQFEQFIGTPAYTSPEQAEMSGLDIDTRSDIYSLGVLLYELLVGKTPFDAKELMDSGLDEMRRMIREQEPMRPSTKLSQTLVAADVRRLQSSPSDRPATDEEIRASSRRLLRIKETVTLLKGDLDWIVMKCLEKDRTRRYDTANGLGSDIEHYLGNEPVSARPPSRIYRFSKLVRRNKLAFAASTAVVMALVIGIVVSTWQAARAYRAEQAAKEEKDSAEAMLKFFLDNVIAAGRPETLGKDVTLRQAIDAAESQIAKTFQDRPLLETSIRKKLGSTYNILGEPALAVQQLELAMALAQEKLGPEHPLTISALDTLGGAYIDAGKPEKILPFFEEVFRLRKAKLGPEHPDTLDSMHRLARAYSDAGKLQQALVLNEETFRLTKIRFGPEHPNTLFSMQGLGVVYLRQKKHEQAAALFEEILKLQKAKLDPDHPDVLIGLSNLAGTYSNQGNNEKAVAVFEELVELYKAKIGPEHPDTLNAKYELARAYVKAGKHDLALALFEEVLKLRQAKLGPEHPDTLKTMFHFAGAYWDEGKLDRAVQLDEQTLKLRRDKLGLAHPDTLESMDFLADEYREMGRFAVAEALFREKLKLDKDSLGASIKLARVLLEWANTDTSNRARAREHAAEGQHLARNYLSKARLRYTNDVAKLEESLDEVAELRYRQRQYAEAEPLYRELLQNQRARLGAEHNDVIGTTASLARLLADWAWAERTNIVAADVRRRLSSSGSQPAPAHVPAADQSLVTSAATVPYERAREGERLLRECLALRLRDNNATQWRVADVKSRLGGALVSVAVTDPELNAAAREAKLAEAETLLLEGSQQLQASQSADRKYKRDALERLVRLYEAWGQPEKLSEAQQTLAAFDKAKTQSAAPAEQSSQ